MKIFITLLVTVLISYRGVFSTFYQQDEWQTFANYIIGGPILPKYLSFLQIFFAEGRILSRLFYYVFLGIFQYSLTPVFIFAVVCHALNAWLIYRLVTKLKGGILAGVIAAVFFAVNSLGNQAVTWASAVTTVPAATMILISLYWYIDFLDTKNIRMRNLSFVLAIFSLFIKETGLFIFFFYPVLYFLWGKAKNGKDVIRANAPILVYGGILVVFRIAEFLIVPSAAAGFVENKSGGYIFSVIYHAIVYQLTSFSQLFVLASDLYAFVPHVIRSEYPYFITSPLFDLAGQSVVADLLSLLCTLFLLFFVGCMVLVEKQDTRAKRIVSVGILLVILSFLPYAVLHRYFSYMSSRYYYVGAAGGAFLFGYIVDWIYKRIPRAMGIFVLIIVGLYLFRHTQAIQKDLDLQIQYANERKTFLREIKRVHPAMNDQTVFYITSDKKYLGEITYPFQNGLGFILEVWYFNSGKIPKRFIEDIFLWDLGEEGYRSAGASGFGYFEHLDKLGEFVKEGKITPDIVYGYVYNSSTRKFSDVTLTVRDQLSTLSGTLR